MKSGIDENLDSASPLITVITAVYNAEQHLEESIRSVLTQTYPKVQYILVDGGSTDRSVDIIKKYHEKIDYWVSERDKGIYDAWNKALQKARGHWICFIGADDFFCDNQVVANMAKHLKNLDKQGKKYVYGTVTYLSPDKSEVIEVVGEEWANSKKQFSDKMTLMHCGAFHHEALFREHGNFNINFKITGDYEFLLREFCKNDDFAAFVNTPVVGMRMGGISGSLNNRLLMAREMRLARKLNGLTKGSLPLTTWILRIKLYILLKKMFGDRLSNRLADFYRMLSGKRKRWSV